MFTVPMTQAQGVLILRRVLMQSNKPGFPVAVPNYATGGSWFQAGDSSSSRWRQADDCG